MIPTNVTATIHRQAATSTDAYGNPTGAWTTAATAAAWFERLAHNSTALDGTAHAADWMLVIPDSAVSLAATDRVVVDGETYEVSTTPTARKTPGGFIHHIEARLRPAAPQLQAMTIAELPDQCAIARPTAASTAGDGSLVAASTTPVWSGPCRISLRESREATPLVAGDQVTVLVAHALVPYDVDDVEVDDHFTVTASEDGRLQGRTLRVVAVAVMSNPAGRVLSLEDEQH
jgi:hypothetical protein